MGCWDSYCCVCAGPFSRFSKDYPECKYINDAWLEKVTIKYINKLTYPDRDIIPNCTYDSYGCFIETKSGVEHDHQDVIAYHSMCASKNTYRLAEVYRKYHRQFFQIETMIEDGKHVLLDKARALAYCHEHSHSVS